jgi:outer membrane protein TolC
MRIAAALLLVTTTAAAAPLDLAGAQAAARENSLMLRKLRLELEAARKLARAAGTLPPTRMFAALRKELEDFRTFKFPPFAGVTQPFDLFGSRRASRRVAEADVALAELAIRGFEQGLEHQVARRYRSLQYRQDLLLAARFSRDLAARFLDVASRRTRAGEAASVDLVRAETEHTHAQGEERRAALEALRAARELGEAMGDPSWESTQVRDRLPGLRLTSSKVDLVVEAMAYRVDLQALEQVAARHAAEARRQRQRRRPVVSGELAVKQEENETFEYGGLRVDFTPSWHGRIGHEAEARELRRRATILERDDLARRIEIRVGGLLREVGLLEERLELFEGKELPSTARQLVMVEQGYRRGGLDNLAVLTAQHTAADTIREYLGVLHEYHQTLLELRREAGMAPLELTPAPTSPEVRGWLDR